MLMFYFISQKSIDQCLSKTQSFIPPPAVGCAVGFSLILIAVLFSELNKFELNDFGVW